MHALVFVYTNEGVRIGKRRRPKIRWADTLTSSAG